MQEVSTSRRMDYFRVPRALWRLVKRVLPKEPVRRGPGRKRKAHRAVLNGIWYVLWTGCQWKAIHQRWFGVSSSVLHERYVTWRKAGIWQKVMQRALRYYHRQRRIQWRWQALDSKSVPAPLGGSQTGPNPTDRGKSGSKVHVIVDERGAPLAVVVTGANDHDKWSAGELIVSIVVRRPTQEQHLCADKGYDYIDTEQIIVCAGYLPHIARRRKKGEPAPDWALLPLDQRHPARRWVVERTLNWLAKRRSIRTRWAKQAENWLAFLQFACADLLVNMALSHHSS
jgi:putative transposase